MGTGDRTRTCTPEGRWLLKPLRLPFRHPGPFTRESSDQRRPRRPEAIRPSSPQITRSPTGGSHGERAGNRTLNLGIKSPLLCQLSYAPGRTLASLVARASPGDYSSVLRA